MTLSSSNGSEKPVENEIFVARISCFMQLDATIEGAQFRVPIEQFTEVLAQEEGPDDFIIVWPYGVASAEARVPASVLIF